MRGGRGLGPAAPGGRGGAGPRGPAPPPPPRSGAPGKQGHPRGHAAACPLAPGSGTEPTLVPAQPCSPGTGRAGEVTHRRVGLGKGHPLSPSEVRLSFLFVVCLIFVFDVCGLASPTPPLVPPSQGFRCQATGSWNQGPLRSASRHLLLGGLSAECRTFVPRLGRFGSDTLESRKHGAGGPQGRRTCFRPLPSPGRRLKDVTTLGRSDFSVYLKCKFWEARLGTSSCGWGRPRAPTPSPC